MVAYYSWRSALLPGETYSPSPAWAQRTVWSARAPSGSATQRTFWAVGYQGASTRTFDPQIGDWIPGGGAQTLIERTDDGGQTWSIVSSPNLTGTNVLKSVSASSADDAWAVGYYDDGTGARTLILHWDGFEWRTEPGVHEEGATDDFLYGVSAVDSTHARAVGFSLYDPPLIPSLNLQATWDGTQWVEDQNKPVPSEYYNYLFGVTAIKDNQAHAVGAYFSDATTRATQALKWFNPSVGWLQESSPNPGPVSNTFWGIAPVSSTYIWAVGSAEYSSGSPPTRTLTARRSGDVYNGTWESVTSPNVGTNKNELRAVEVVPGTSPCAGGNNWAVGYYLDSSGVAHTLAMVYTITPQCDLTP